MDNEQRLIELLEELAQTSDNDNIKTKFDDLEAKLEQEDQRRWRFFIKIVIGFATVLGIVLPLFYYTDYNFSKRLEDVSIKMNTLEVTDKRQVLIRDHIILQKDLEKTQKEIYINQKDIIRNQRDIEKNQAEIKAHFKDALNEKDIPRIKEQILKELHGRK